MKKSILFLFVITMLILSVSCINKTEKNQAPSDAQQTDSHQQKQPIAPQKEAHSQENDGTLQLNNGNLWEANIETTKGIETMKIVMNSFKNQENKEAYLNLKQDLEKKFSTIITKCTMTGEAHDQLHKYLLPMKALFDGLAAPDLASRKASINKINAYLEEYPKYFK